MLIEVFCQKLIVSNVSGTPFLIPDPLLLLVWFYYGEHVKVTGTKKKLLSSHFAPHISTKKNEVRKWYNDLKKQPSKAVLKKRCSENLQQSYRSTPMQSNFIDITLRHGCSPVNLLRFAEHLFLRTALDSCF